MQSAKLHQRRGSRSICATKLVSGSLFRLGGGAVAIALQWLSYRCAFRAHRLHAVGNAAARRWVCAACCEQASAAVRNGLCMRRCAPAFDRDLSGSWRQLARINVCSLGRQALERVLCSYISDAVQYNYEGALDSPPRGAATSAQRRPTLPTLVRTSLALAPIQTT